MQIKNATILAAGSFATLLAAELVHKLKQKTV